MPTATLTNIYFLWAFVLIHPMNVRTKFKVRSFTDPEIIGGTQKFGKSLDMPSAQAPSCPKLLMGFSSDASYECTCKIRSP